MKKLVLAVTLAAVSAPAFASGMTYFLQKQWYDKGNTFCQYSNGTVLNMGIKLCPMSITG